MDLHFREGDTFMTMDEQWIVVHIDYWDDEYPYECYPIETVEKAKQIVKDGGIIDGDAFDNYYDVLEYEFIDERICWSDFDILEYKFKAVEKENESLKAEIKKLKGEN